MLSLRHEQPGALETCDVPRRPCARGACGVAALFGSVRDEIGRAATSHQWWRLIQGAITVFDYVDSRSTSRNLFDGPVYVVSRDSLKPYIRPTATADAIYAFYESRDCTLLTSPRSYGERRRIAKQSG